MRHGLFSCRGGRVHTRTRPLEALWPWGLAPMGPDILALPREHRHGDYPRLDFSRRGQAAGVDLAAVEDSVEECGFAGRQVKERRQPLAAERDGLRDPGLYTPLPHEPVAREADGELLAQLVRIAPDVVDRGLTPVAASRCAIGKDGGLNPAPVEIGNVEDAARVEQIPGRF